RPLAAAGYQHLEALVARQVKQHAGVVRVILHDEQYRIGGCDVVAIVGDLLHPRRCRASGWHHCLRCRRGNGRCCLGMSQAYLRLRQIEGERAAGAWRAAQANLAAEELRELAADRETETRAAILARRAGVRLLERLEDDALL